MLTKLIQLAAKIAVGKQLAQGVAAVHDKLDGHRSEISAGLLALIHTLKLVGVIPAAQADIAENALMAVLPVVLADKVSKALKTADAVMPQAEPNPEVKPK